MTRFEYLKENITQRQMAKYLAEKEDCQGECREFCNNYYKSLDDDVNIGCYDVMYEYLGTEIKEE